MAEPWFVTWAEKHALTFAMNDDAFLQTLLSWEDLFAAAGYSREDLASATTALATSGVQLQRWDHLAAITKHVRERKAVERRDAPPDDPRGKCATCEGTGFVVVPHPEGVVEGEWVPQKVARGGATYYTVAVHCHCPLGRWFHGRRTGAGSKYQGTWTLAAYEEKNPRWRVQIEARRQESLERSRLSSRKPGPLDEVIARLKRQYGLED